MRCAATWPGTVGIYILLTAVGRHGHDRVSDSEEQLLTPKRAGRVPAMRKGMGNTMYPETEGGILMSDRIFGLPNPS